MPLAAWARELRQGLSLAASGCCTCVGRSWSVATKAGCTSPELRGRIASGGSIRSVVSTNARFRWEYIPGSELFIVYNEERDTVAPRFPDLANRSFIVKINRLLRF